MTVVYLAGPINGCNDDEAHGWRQGRHRRLGYFCWLLLAGIGQEIQYAWAPREDMRLRPAPESEGSIFDVVDSPYIVLVVPEGQRISPWLRYHSDAVVATLKEAQTLCRAYQDRADNVACRLQSVGTDF